LLKILFIDSSNDGHHIPYLKGIVDSQKKFTSFFILPKGKYNLPGHVFEYKESGSEFNLISYLTWLKFIKKIYKKINPDIICFLYGDVFYKRFGIGLKCFSKNCRVIIIFHQFRERPFIRNSLKRIFRHIEVGIVHTRYNLKELINIGIKNVQQIEYPQLYPYKSLDINEAREKLGLPKERIILAAMGATSYYKGLDILLEALTLSKGKFDLLIAGKLTDFNKDFINKYNSKIKGNIYILNGPLSDEDFHLAISASNLIVLPYRKVFDGASGPLIEAVWADKPVIGSDSKSLGELIKREKIGLTFKSDDSIDLSNVIDESIHCYSKFSNGINQYKTKISKINFQQEFFNLFIK